MLSLLMGFVTKFVDVLNSARVLADSTKRRRLASTLVDLHQTLGRLAENSAAIEKTLEKMVQPTSKVGYPQTASLQSLLQKQQHEFHNLRMIFSPKAARVFVDLYGDEVREIVQSLWIQKTDLISMVVWLLEQERNFIVIPNEKELGPVAAQGINALNKWDIGSNEFIDLATTKIPLDAPPEVLLPALKTFYAGVTRMQADENFRQCQKKIAATLREHFKLEELIP